MSLATNRKAHLQYEIMETYTAGIELFGFEVKSLRAGRGVIDGAHVTVRGGEAFVTSMSIPPYQENNTPDGYIPDRNRRLLLSKDEILEIEKAEKTKGLTIVPLSVYNKWNKIKLDIAIVRGKKKFDKRETLKKRQVTRDIEREHKVR